MENKKKIAPSISGTPWSKLQFGRSQLEKEREISLSFRESLRTVINGSSNTVKAKT